jgi:large subunit ribosomal protein L34e
MVKPSFRSRTFRRVYRKTPGGRNVLQHRKRKPSKATCYKCGKILPAVPRERVYIMQRMPKTKKRPERPYGGVLCSACMRLEMIKKARKQ